MVLKNKRKIVINREKWKWHLGFSLAIVLINDRIRTVFVCKLSKIGAVNKNDRSQAGLGSETDWPNLSSSIQMVAFCEFSFHVNGRDFVSLFYPQVTQAKNEIFYTYCTYVCSCFRHMWIKNYEETIRAIMKMVYNHGPFINFYQSLLRHNFFS